MATWQTGLCCCLKVCLTPVWVKLTDGFFGLAFAVELIPFLKYLILLSQQVRLKREPNRSGDTPATKKGKRV